MGGGGTTAALGTVGGDAGFGAGGGGVGLTILAQDIFAVGSTRRVVVGRTVARVVVDVGLAGGVPLTAARCWGGSRSTCGLLGLLGVAVETPQTDDGGEDSSGAFVPLTPLMAVLAAGTGSSIRVGPLQTVGVSSEAIVAAVEVVSDTTAGRVATAATPPRPRPRPSPLPRPRLPRPSPK